MSDILLSWTLFLFAFPIFFGLGASVMSMAPPDFTLAKWCFGIAAFIAAARLGWWLAVEQTLTTDDIKVALATFALFGCIGILWVGSLRWVENRQQAFTASNDQRDTHQKQETPTKEEPPQVSSTNQSVGITAGSIGTIIINPPVPSTKPQVILEEPTLLNAKTEEGYQTVIPLKIISTQPVATLYIAVHMKTIKRADLSLPGPGVLIGGLHGVEEGRAFTRAHNVHGTLLLIIITGEPINATNQARIEYDTE